MTATLIARYNRIMIALVFAVFVTACDQAGIPHSEYQPRWQKIIDTNPLDGSKEIQMLVAAVGRSPSQDKQVILVLTCMQGATNAYVVWRRYLGVYDPEVTWRIGSDSSVSETWVLSTDNEATFSPQPIELIKQMMTNELFLIKTTPFGSDPVTMEFNTAGLKTEIVQLRAACGW